MTILPHVDNIQDNGYFCGPATLQVLLGIRGVPVSEQQAAVEAHTTVEGTPTVEDIARVLNAHLGGAYRTVYVGGNSATPEQVAQLRADVTASINAKYGVAVNVVGPATGTLADGRTEVNLYSGGHYFPVTGITDAGLPWCTDVADGHEYSMTWQALGDWIASRGYATITAATAAQSTVEEEDMATIVKNADDGKFYVLGADGVARKLALKSANAIADVGYVVSGRYDPSGKDAGPRAGRLPYTNAPTGSAPWIDIPVIPLSVIAVEDQAAGPVALPAQLDITGGTLNLAAK